MNIINKRKDIALGDFSLEPSENFNSIFLKMYVILNCLSTSNGCSSDMFWLIPTNYTSFRIFNFF